MPICIAEDKNGISAGSLSFGGKDQAAERGLHTQDGKIISCNAGSDTVIAAIVGGDAAQSDVVSDDVAERGGLGAKIKVVRIGKVLEGLVAGLLKGEDGELLGMRHGHGAQKETVDDAEDGGIDGDAQGKRNYTDGGEPRR